MSSFLKLFDTVCLIWYHFEQSLKNALVRKFLHSETNNAQYVYVPLCFCLSSINILVTKAIQQKIHE